MDNRLKRFLSLALAMVMVIGMMPTNIVFATEEGGSVTEQPEIVAPTTEPVVEESSETSTQETTETTTQETTETTAQETTAPSETEATQHQCVFVEIAKVEPTWTTAGSRTVKCECGEEKTERLCATGCWMDSYHQGDCEIMCDKDKSCGLDYGHDGLCVSPTGVLLVSNITTADQLKNALASNTSGEITLAANIVLTEMLTVPEGVTATLNLNGHDITVAAPEGVENAVAPNYALNNLGNLTVKGNGTVHGTQNGVDGTNTAELTILSGTFEKGAGNYAVLNYGTATIKGGTFESDGNYALRNHRTMTITTTIENNTAAVVKGAYNAGSLHITAGDFTSVAEKHAVESFGGSLTIEGGTFDNNIANDTTATIKVGSNGVATIDSGALDTDADSLVLQLEDTAHVTINGGNINDGIAVATGATLTINGGSFQDPGVNSNDVKGTAVVNGGTFTDTNSQALAAYYAAEGKIIKFGSVDKVKSGEHTVSDVIATIGTGESLVAYPSLEKAVKAAKNDETVKVVANWTIAEPMVIINKAITINADKAVTITNDQIDAFQVGSGATLTLGGKLTINSNNALLYALDGGDIVIAGAEIVVSASPYCAACVTGNGSTIAVQSGTINQKRSDKVTISVENNAVVTVSGGTVQSENSSAIAAQGGAVVNITGGTVKTICEEPTFCAVYATDKGKINISGGTVSAAAGIGAVACADGEVAVSNGTVTGGVKAHENDQAKATITGGKVYGNVSAADGASLVITGGTFGTDPAVEYIKDGYESVENLIVGGKEYVVQLKKVDLKVPTDPDVLSDLLDNNSTNTTITPQNVLDAIAANEGFDKDVVNDTGYRLEIIPAKVVIENGTPYQTSRIAYSVTPINAAGEKKHTFENEIYFNLPIPGSKAGHVEKANIYRSDSLENLYDESNLMPEECEIKGSDGNWYVNVGSKEFSYFGVELIDIDEEKHVARIGVKGYQTVAAAVSAVQNGQTIYLLGEREGYSYGDVAINLNNGKNFAIDGEGKYWPDANITISGGTAANTTEPLVTIKNINFTSTNKTTGAYITISNNSNDVLIQNCSFAGKNTREIVAISLNNAKGVEIDGGADCKGGSNLQAFLVNVGGSDLKIKDVTIKESTVGMTLGTIQGVYLQGVNISGLASTNYGISMDGSVNNAAVFDGCSINAQLPIMVHNATAHGRIVFNSETGANTMSGGVSANNRTFWMILSDEVYLGNHDHGTDPMADALAASGRTIITLNDSNLNSDGINYKYHRQGTNKYYTVAPAGELESSVVFDEPGADNSYIGCDIEKVVASETIELYLYEGSTLLATTEVADLEGFGMSVYNDHFSIPVEISRNSSTWNTTWVTAEECPTYRNVPNKAKLVVDGAVVAEIDVEMYRPLFPEEKRVWTDVEGVGNLTATDTDGTKWYHTLADALSGVKTGGEVQLYDDNTAALSAAGEVTGGKTVTVTTIDRNNDGSSQVTLDWSKDWLYIGRGETAGNGTLIFNNAHIVAAGEGDDTGFNVSQAVDGATNKNNGILEITNGSNIVTDFIINRNMVKIDGASTLTVRSAIHVHGRKGADKATVNVLGGSELIIEKDAVVVTLGDDANDEGNGELNVNGSKFTCKAKLNIASGSALNVLGESTLNITEAVGKPINIANGATVKDSSVGGNAVAVGTAEKNISIAFTGTNVFEDITVSYGTLNTNTESTITAKKIILDSEFDKVVIDAAKLDKEDGVQVIDQTNSDAALAAYKANISVKDNLAAKRVADDGDVYIYFEAFIDKNGDTKLTGGIREGYATLEEAIAAAEDNQTVYLLVDKIVSDLIVIDNKITLNLKGHTISGEEILGIDADGVTVKNGKLDATNIAIAVDAGASLMLTDVTVEADSIGVMSFGKVTLGDKAVVKGINADADPNTANMGIALCNAGEADITAGMVSGDIPVAVFGGKLNVTGGTVDGGLGTAILTVCYDDAFEDIDVPVVAVTEVNISGGNVIGGIYVTETDKDKMPEGYQATVSITGGMFTNTDLYAAGEINRIVVSGGIFDKFVPYEMCALDYLCQETAATDDALYEVIYKPHRRVYLNDDKITEGGVVYFDGDDYTVMPGKVILLEHEQAKKSAAFVTSYQMKGTGEGAYPEHMYVWYVTGKDINNNGIYTSYDVKRVAALDDFFQYHGTSIRIGGGSNGIRFFTSVNESDANKLMTGTMAANHKGVANTLSGAKMTSTGTEFWKREDNKLRSEVYGGAVGNVFRTFQNYQGRNWYTGVLVGLESSGSAVKDAIYTRPYATVQVDGKTVTLYGGLMARSIYYVAWQNRDTFNGTVYDSYVEALIKMGQ